jgi:hypothetical protein
MESMFYRGHRFLGRIKHFGWPWDCGRRTSFWKTLQVKSRRKCDQSECSREVWSTFDGHNDRYWVEFESPNRPRHFDPGTGHADTWMLHHDDAPVTLPSPWTTFWPKRVFQWFQVTILAWSETVWLLHFPRTQIPPHRSSFRNCDNLQKVVTDQLMAVPHEDFQHCHRQWERRLPRCVASQGNYFQGERCWFLVELLIKKFIAPVALLFRHTLYFRNCVPA